MILKRNNYRKVNYSSVRDKGVNKISINFARVKLILCGSHVLTVIAAIIQSS